MTIRPMKAERGTPVMDYQRHSFAQLQRVEPRVEMARVIGETIFAAGRLTGVAHPDQVRREASPESREMGNHIAPEIGRCGIPMQKYDRITGPCVGISHRGAEQLGAFSWIRVFCRNFCFGHSKLSAD